MGSIGRFLKNRSGAFAMQFALMAVPLTICTGLAIDGGRVFLARYELNSALDAAALAVGSTFAENADINAMAHNFVNRNFHGDHQGEIGLTLDSTNERVLLKGSVVINTYFMPLIGRPTVEIAAESEVKRGGNNVEVALALDVTESMGPETDTDSRIHALRTAAKDLIDTVVNDVQTPYYSRVAIVPWANNVYVDTYANALHGDLKGPINISEATWRDGVVKSITNATWRDGAAKNVTGATWRNGATAYTISGITKANPAVVTTSAAHGYADNDYVYISGVSGMTQVNSKRYKIDVTSTTKFSLMNADTGVAINSSGYSTWSAGSPNNGRVQKCFTQTCEVQVTVASHGYADGNWVYLASVGGMTEINNSGSTPWTIKNKTASTFILTGTTGPSYTAYTSGGTSSKCFTATCEVQVTAAGHGWSNGDLINIRDVGGITQINRTDGNTWVIADKTTNTFMLPGTQGPTFGTYTNNTGKASKCFAAGCEVRLRVPGHDLSNDSVVQISGTVGMTQINAATLDDIWTVKAVSGEYFRLDGTIGPNYGDYTSGGALQCLDYGCIKFRFQNIDSPKKYVIRSASKCVSARTGANAATDVAPSTSPVSPDYAGTGQYVDCQAPRTEKIKTKNYPRNNTIVPLTDDKTVLKDKIDQLDLTGATAGQMGAAWGWYMVSPNWGYLWPETKNKPKPYETKELAKVVVLMTDGEFNTSHCNGVVSSNFGVNNSADRINCKGADPFTLAENVCDGMRAAKIKVYAVGFELEEDGDAEDFMRYCATDESHLFLAASNDELKSAFKSIATQISRLRISK